MRKVELLSPAGNMETLMAAIKNGCDAVYLGGKAFGARAFAKNFDNEELKEAVRICHLYGVKIYVTANILVYENEISEFIQYLKFLYLIGVDAVIMQDLGMISLVKKLIPDLEVHASTQINSHNKESIDFLKSIGVSRVVLAREMDEDEIRDLSNILEIEVFVHGALCVSYSGNCLFSSLNGGRSGNRGMCAGSCRLPYDLYDDKGKVETDGKYLLSTKDLFLADHIKELLDLNVSSLKIEGRMKSPEYVGYVTKVYRRLIDEYYKNGNPQITKDEIINLKKLFNRSFTSGYFLHDDIYNIKTPNHIGYPLGKIIKIDKNKIYIKLSDDLYQEDGIRFNGSSKGMIVNKLYDDKGLLKNKIDKGMIAVLDNKLGIKDKESVNKTIDSKLTKEINKVSDLKIPIDIKVTAKAFEPLKVSFSDGKHIVSLKSITLDKALNKPTSLNDIKDKLCSFGDFPFKVNELTCDLDDVFIPMKFLKEIKRNLANKLISKRCEVNREATFKYDKEIDSVKDINNLSILVRNENQLKEALEYAYRIYTEDFELYKKYKENNVYFKLPRIMHNFPEYENENLLISEIGGIFKYAKNNHVISDYPVNVTNSETVSLLQKYGCEIDTLSPEIKDYSLIDKYVHNTEKIIYGRLDLMILKDFYDKDDNIKLKNSMGNYFPIIQGDYVTILHHENLNIKDISGNSRIILFNEKDLKNIIKK